MHLSKLTTHFNGEKRICAPNKFTRLSLQTDVTTEFVFNLYEASSNTNQLICILGKTVTLLAQFVTTFHFVATNPIGDATRSTHNILYYKLHNSFVPLPQIDIYPYLALFDRLVFLIASSTTRA